ncbi:MAG: hypothetical protein AAFP17_12825 [Pseudomonadota bacterium]
MEHQRSDTETPSPDDDDAVQGATLRERPRRLVAAARHCALAMLRSGRGPRQGEEEECAMIEAACEQTRQRRPLAYSNRRHVEALARLLAAEARAAAASAQA